MGASRLSRRYLKWISLGIGALMLVSVVAGCGQQSASTGTKTINIAVIVPLSGSNAEVGQQSVNAAKLAVADINAAGGIKSLGGAKLNLVVADSTDSPQSAATAASRVFTQDKVSAAYGMDLSPLTTAALPVIARYHIPMVTASIADALTQQGNKYIFEIAPKGSQFGATEVQFVKYLDKVDHLKLTKAAIVYVDNPYGQSTAAGVAATVKSAGLTVVMDTAYPSDITDATPLVADIKKSGAQLLFPVSYVTDAGLILNALKATNSNVLVIGGGAGFIWPPIEKAIGASVNGLVSVASWNWDSKNVLDNPDLVSVTQRYEQAYGTFMPEQAGEAYAGVWTIADALEKAASSDPQKVRDALAGLSVSSGGAALMQPGTVAYDQTGFNSPTHPVMIQWEKNKPRTVFPVSDAAMAPVLNLK